MLSRRSLLRSLLALSLNAVVPVSRKPSPIPDPAPTEPELKGELVYIEFTGTYRIPGEANEHAAVCLH